METYDPAGATEHMFDERLTVPFVYVIPVRLQMTRPCGCVGSIVYQPTIAQVFALAGRFQVK
jgi:hypothetical protein